MRLSPLLLTLFLFLFGGFSSDAVSNGVVYISEIMYDSPLNERIAISEPYSNGEFIELFNDSEDNIDLSGWRICGGGKTETYVFPHNFVVMGKSHVVLFYRHIDSEDFDFENEYDILIQHHQKLISQRKIILSNSGEFVVLKDRNGVTKDSIYYDGTSNKTKPNRLSADNEDGIPFTDCVSLTRKRVLINTDYNCMFNPFDWEVKKVSPSYFVSDIEVKHPSQPSRNKNYIKISEMQNPDGTKSLDEIKYYDLLGRPSETILVGYTPSRNDLAQGIIYDQFGHPVEEWLPTPIAGSSGNIVNGLMQETASYYQDDYAYKRFFYDDSPLDRIVKTVGGGSYWHSSAKGISKEYLTNTDAGELCVNNYYTENCQLFKSGIYPAGELFVEKIIDENGNYGYKFVDKLGRLILERMKISRKYADTYYIYDDYGNLSYVLPPVASDNLINDGIYGLSPESTLGLYAYFNRYDDFGRCIEKKIPGIEPVYMVYDYNGRLILSQTGNQRVYNKWTVNKYDVFGRLLYISEIKDLTPFEDLLHRFSTSHVLESFSLSPHTHPMGDTGYSRDYFHVSPTDLLTVNYYDKYDFLQLLPDPVKNELAYSTKEGYDTYYENATGVLTGTRTYSLENPQLYTVTAYYYDIRGRLVQEHSTNHMAGYEKNYYQLSYTGKILKHLHEHTIPHGESIHQIYEYDYDHAERLLGITHQLNDLPSIQLVAYTYDELGRMVKKNQHSGNSTRYSYNIRNWITQIINKDFTQTLSYDGMYNGNITQSSTGVTYDYKYDELNRLTDASNSLYYEKVHYDKHGNITMLFRNGATGSNADNSYGVIDDLSLSYNGNQLLNVIDRAPNDPIHKGTMHFVDGSNAESAEYAYDACGNMIKDLNKGLEITYNSLNLPRFVSHNIYNCNAYHYNSSGVKQQAVYSSFYRNVPMTAGIPVSVDDVPSRISITTVNYCGNIIYKDDKLDRILTPEGYIDKDRNDNFVYHYYIKDHLGNNRVVVNQHHVVEQKYEYYPFGGLSKIYFETQDDQPFKYNGKELDRMCGLDWYDYAGRMQDPILDRFVSIDPLCEKYYNISPYAYCFNNPVRYIDPDGMAAWEINRQGNIWKLTNQDAPTTYDILYAVNAPGVRTGKSITLNDMSILPQLANHSEKGTPDHATVGEKGKADLFKLFLFTAHNTDVEWVIYMYSEGRGNKYTLGTVHDPVNAGSYQKYGITNPPLSKVHSHPANEVKKDRISELSSMGVWENGKANPSGGDWQNVLKDIRDNGYRPDGLQKTLSYVYFPRTSNLYHISYYGPAFIRTIDNKYNRFFFGTF